MSERDFDASCYSPSEERVAAWMRERIPDMDVGGDPIGFLVASYGLLVAERASLRSSITEATEDAWILASHANGWTPDRNTQTPKEVATTEEIIRQAACRSVARGMAAQRTKETSDV